MVLTDSLRSATLPTLAALTVIATLTACSDDAGGTGGNDDGEDTAALGAAGAEGDSTDLLIVASTDVYADLARQVVGDSAEVEAVVDNPAVDPHSYEATAQDRLQIEEADVVVANGGGYDPFITQLAASAGLDDAVFDAFEGQSSSPSDHDHGASSDDHDHSDDHSYANEHLWYDLAAMSAFLVDFGEHMGELAPQNEEVYAENAEAAAAQIDELAQRNRAVEAEGLNYLATEAVSGLMLDDAGFDDVTDVEFLSAVEHGDDVSPRLYQQALDLVTGDDVDLLVYNRQTETNQSMQIREAAEEAGVPVLEFTETFPEDDEDYLSWMTDNVEQIEELVADA